MLPNNACSMFVICPLISAFANLCALVVLPSTIHSDHSTRGGFCSREIFWRLY
jgi:hypothetical protein